jgi:hypothetical protein
VACQHSQQNNESAEVVNTLFALSCTPCLFHESFNIDRSLLSELVGDSDVAVVAFEVFLQDERLASIRTFASWL